MTTTTTININIVSINNIVNHNGMPVAVITACDEEVGYLSPFRSYTFQVSETVDGQWDLGCSQVIGLKNLLSYKRNRTIQRFRLLQQPRRGVDDQGASEGSGSYCTCAILTQFWFRVQV